jgi:hypothetical protein
MWMEIYFKSFVFVLDHRYLFYTGTAICYYYIEMLINFYISESAVAVDPYFNFCYSVKLIHNEGVHFCSRWPGWLPDGQCLLGAVLPGAWYSA